MWASVQICSRSVNGCLWLSPCMSHWGPVSTMTRDQSMVASGCLPACPIEGQCSQSARSVNGCLRLSPWMSHCGPVSTITRDQSMDASGYLPVCPIEGQCPQSLNQSMAASGCLPACPIKNWALLMHMFEVQSSVEDGWHLTNPWWNCMVGVSRWWWVMLVAWVWRWCTRDLGHLCWLELEGEGCMFYLLYPQIICPILDILVFLVTRQQLGLLIRGVNGLETLRSKNALWNLLPT